MAESESSSSYLTPIGAGGYGTVYQLHNSNNVIKAIYGKESCEEAQIEFGKQLRIYNSFLNLKKEEHLPSSSSSDRLLKLINKYVMISKPIDFMDKSIIINDTAYSCTITMTKLNGISLKNFIKLDPNIESRFTSEFINKRGMELQIMAHLALNSSVPGLYGVNYTKTLIGSKNPPRGYFIIEESDILDKIRSNFKLKLSNSDIKQMIGFIYGWILYSTNIIPIDIEITLGLYNHNQFKINVLDFGMTFDLDNIDNNPKLPRTSPFFDILNQSSLSNVEKYNLIIEKSKDDISIDLYGDVNTDDDNIIGFNEAYDLFIKLKSNHEYTSSSSFDRNIEKIFNDINHIYNKPCSICKQKTTIKDVSIDQYLCKEQCQEIYYTKNIWI